MDIVKIYDEILSKLEEGVQVVNNSGVTIIYNKAMAELESMKVDDVLNKDIKCVLPSCGYGSTHLEVMKIGQPIEFICQEYLTKDGKKVTASNSTYPIVENGEIVGSIEISKDLTQMKRMSERVLELYSGIDNKKGWFNLNDILGQSDAIKDVIEKSVQIAKTTSNVLIVGESGTGKEMFAQGIHNASLRKNKPFVAENCAAIPENLLESTLFGTTKGGFTGAENKEGLLSQANGGTLMLDEINSMPFNLQAKILRVLETGRFRPVGSSKEKKVDIRIIAVTNKDPLALVKEGKFREDLFYRLSVTIIRVPSLCERKDDIELLTEHFIKYYESTFSKSISGVSESVSRFFKKYKWPGNIRELKNVIEGAVCIMQDGEEIQLKHMPYYMKDAAKMTDENLFTGYIQENIKEILNKTKSLENVVQDVEKVIIRDVLAKSDYNVAKAAEILGVKRQGLQYKIKKYFE